MRRAPFFFWQIRFLAFTFYIGLSIFFICSASAQDAKAPKANWVILFPATPNPFDDKCLVRMYLPEPDPDAELRIVNSTDEIVMRIPIGGIKGIQSAQVNMTNQPKGTFMCQLLFRGKVTQSNLLYHGVSEKGNYRFDSTALTKKLSDLDLRMKNLDFNFDILSGYVMRQDSVINARIDGLKSQDNDSLQKKIRKLNHDVVRLRLKLESFEQLMRELSLLKITKKTFDNPMKKGSIYNLTRIYFNTGNFDFPPRSKAELEDLTSVLKEFPSLSINIMGHTDDKGSFEANMALSRQRAKMVYDYLLAQGIDASRLNYEGFGSQRPFTENLTEEDRAINRRVEFVILKE